MCVGLICAGIQECPHPIQGGIERFGGLAFFMYSTKQPLLQWGECQKLMKVKKRGTPATSAPSRSYLPYKE